MSQAARLYTPYMYMYMYIPYMYMYMYIHDTDFTVIEFSRYFLL